MRYGFTTGSCAAAAAKAAAYMLISGKKKEQIEIDTPKGLVFHAKIVDIYCTEKAVQCAVIKDGGDDPDVTTGAHVVANVSFSGEQEVKINSHPEIELTGGEGIGVVTKPGLDQPVGAAAINRIPRQMIISEVLKVCELLDYHGAVNVHISIPEGRELANQTFNPRLGIIGGISVLGTSGIVEPMSEQALLDTIKAELSVKRAQGNKIISISPGNYGLEFLKRTYGFDLDTSIKCSNFIGQTLDMIVDMGFDKVLLLGHMGKLVKVSGGIMNTHSKEGDCRMELLAAAGIKAGVPIEILAEILQCVTTEEAVNILKDTGKDQEIMQYIVDQILYYCNKRTKEKIDLQVILYTNEQGELIKSHRALEFLRELEEI